ncbi:MAG: BamA/TamA family outer membrane protein [Ignavibacterium sp.]|nr:BamA/TamA family outer membrane protein [Ignavibacterium sp.]
MNNNVLQNLIIAFLLLSGISFSQIPDSISVSKLYHFKVDSISIKGNEQTEEFIIRRELTFDIGDTLSAEIVKYNRERIYSLGLFAHVFVYPIEKNSTNILEIFVEERWYIYPIPFVTIKEKDFNKLSFGIYLKINNFRGRNEEITAVAAFGYDPAYSINYYNPNLIGKEDFFLKTGLIYSDVSNKSPSAEILYGEEFSQKFFRTHFLFGKRLGLFHKLYLATSYNYYESPKYIPGINVSGDRIDRFPELQFGYEFDSRDLIQFPRDGIFASASFSFNGLGINSINYNVARIDFREYRKIVDNLFSKWRFSARFTNGNEIPFYDYSILGIDEKVRGYFTRKTEGNHFYFASAEFFYPIIEELNLDFDFIPIIPEQLLKFRIALYTQAFGDAGTTQYKDQSLSFNRFISGYGLGLTLLVLPYNILRIEYALDNFGNNEWIFDLGVSF